MKLKLDENGGVVLEDGTPIYIQDDGKEVAYDVANLVQTIGRLNGEAKSHRMRYEEAQSTLKAFEGIEDPILAKKALETVANLESKKLIDAGEVEKVKAELSKAFQTQIDSATALAKQFEKQLYEERIGGAFSRSKLINEKFTIPSDLVQARFGSAFKIEDGKIIAYDNAGNRIYSASRPGEPADFDEALEELVNQYPYKNTILKAPVSHGSGASSNQAKRPMTLTEQHQAMKHK